VSESALAVEESESGRVGEYRVPAVGVDDVTLGFDMDGSKSLAALKLAPGVETRRGKMLGERASWGSWAHLLGRSTAFWKADTKRLYVQAKLREPGELCPPSDVRRAYAG
jgi:hypothetical protein